MPKIFEYFGYVFYFYSNEQSKINIKSNDFYSIQNKVVVILSVSYFV